MSDEKKKSESSELSEEQVEKVAGGIIHIPKDRLESLINPEIPEIPDLPEPPLPYLDLSEI